MPTAKKVPRPETNRTLPPARPQTDSVTRVTTAEFFRAPLFHPSHPPCACGGTCPRCQKSSPAISAPDDPREREAEAVADQVLRPASPAHSHQLHSSPPPTKPLIQSDRIASSRPPAHMDTTAAVRATQAGGAPLPDAVRAQLEPRFGHDFSRVRIHTDGAAAQAARSVHARAYAFGSNIVFGAGEYSPATTAGQHLIAHELVHVIQQEHANPTMLCRVPTRSGVSDGRYSFSNNCGWIDWSHAQPHLASPLIDRVRAASDALRTAGTNPPAETGDMTTPTMTSTVPHVGLVLSSASLSVRLLRPLSDTEILEVALSLFKKLSVVFETQQQWTDLIGSSSFSQEDLPSNLIGFYMAAHGLSQSDIGTMCEEASVDEALTEFDRDNDFERNRSFAPPDILGSWPADLDTINDLQASALYEIRTISAVQGSSGFQFCPMYRIQGTIGETDLLITSIGGKRFTAADNVRVVPTYRFRSGTHGLYGHTTFIEVEPNGQGDFLAFSTNGLSWPMYVPRNVLVCLNNHGNPPT